MIKLYKTFFCSMIQCFLCPGSAWTLFEHVILSKIKRFHLYALYIYLPQKLRKSFCAEKVLKCDKLNSSFLIHPLKRKNVNNQCRILLSQSKVFLSRCHPLLSVVIFFYCSKTVAISEKNLKKFIWFSKNVLGFPHFCSVAKASF